MKKIFNHTTLRRIGLLAFIATGGGLLVSTALNDSNVYKTEIMLVLGCFFLVSLVDHYRHIMTVEHQGFQYKKLLMTILYAGLGVIITWFINHEVGYGPIIANGLVGIMAATFLPNNLAGIVYTSSFIGMSSKTVIPDLYAATLASVIVGCLLVITSDIYAGIGGKGGTTAALSTIITKNILGLFR